MPNTTTTLQLQRCLGQADAPADQRCRTIDGLFDPEAWEVISKAYLETSDTPGNEDTLHRRDPQESQSCELDTNCIPSSRQSSHTARYKAGSSNKDHATCQEPLEFEHAQNRAWSERARLGDVLDLAAATFRSLCALPHPANVHCEYIDLLNSVTKVYHKQMRATKEAEELLLSGKAAVRRQDRGQDEPRAESATNTPSVQAPSLLEQYFHRAGDASIARERIAELEYELAMCHAQNSCPESDIADHQLSELERRRILRAELDAADHDAEALRAACLAQGVDPAEYNHKASGVREEVSE